MSDAFTVLLTGKISYDGTAWTAELQNPAHPLERCSLSGYGPDVFLSRSMQWAEDALLFDFRSAELNKVIRLACSGPMLDPRLPPGTIKTFRGETRQRDDRAEFLGAYSVDDVSTDIYAELCRRHGVTVRPLKEWLQEQE